MNGVETIYVPDHLVEGKQRAGFRCEGRSPAGDMIMRRRRAHGVAQVQGVVGLPRRLAALEELTTNQAAEIERLRAEVAYLSNGLRVGVVADLRQQVKSLRKALPADHPLRVRSAQPPRTRSDLDLLRRAVAEAFDVPLNRMCGRSRMRVYSRARHAFYDLARRRTKCSLHIIGEAVGRTDHNTVFEGIARVKNRWISDPDFASRYARAEALANAE